MTLRKGFLPQQGMGCCQKSEKGLTEELSLHSKDLNGGLKLPFSKDILILSQWPVKIRNVLSLTKMKTVFS